MSQKNYRIKPAGDCAVSVEYENKISEDVNERVSFLKNALESHDISGITGFVPTYRSLLVQYDPSQIAYDALIRLIDDMSEDMGQSNRASAKIYVIPVLYGGDHGPDLEHVGQVNHMSPEDVIARHTAVDYRIYMLGFTPGFPYLGGMDETIATPRLDAPRTKIPAGSVGIAGKQTGIYPIDSPGGWQLIGRTPLKLFDIEQDPPILLEAGNYIRFKAVDMKTFEAIEKQVASGTYVCETLPHGEGRRS